MERLLTKPGRVENELPQLTANISCDWQSFLIHVMIQWQMEGDDPLPIKDTRIFSSIGRQCKEHFISFILPDKTKLKC